MDKFLIISIMIIFILLLANIVQFISVSEKIVQLNSLHSEFELYKTNATAEKAKLLSENQNLNSSYSQLRSEYSKLNISLNKLRVDYVSLNDSYNLLNSELAQLNVSYSSLNTSYVSLQIETEDLLDKIDGYQKNIQDSLSWFNFNSNIQGINDTLKEEQVYYNLRDNCYKIEDGKCRIKTACFYLTNERFLGLEYRSDVTTTGKVDKLVSLHDFVKNWGGDCEDYSLFYKAEINHVLEKCNMSASNIVLEGYVPKVGETEYFVNFPNTFYLDNVEAVELKQNYIYPNVVCGGIYDLNTDQVSGHCIIAFTSSKINSTSEIHAKLSKAPMIEPQTGEYMGLINDASSGIYLVSEEGEHTSYINMIVTDQDLFLFEENTGAWTGYAEYGNELEVMKEKIMEFMK